MPNASYLSNLLSTSRRVSVSPGAALSAVFVTVLEWLSPTGKENVIPENIDRYQISFVCLIC